MRWIRINSWQATACCLAIVVSLPACASQSVGSGAAVGKVGSGLSARAQSVPQGAQACAMKDALATPTPGGAEKPQSDECVKAANSDLLWRRALVVLSAYSQKLDALASGQSPESAGQIEAAMTGVSGNDWVEVEPSEQPARDAVGKLVSLMSAKDEKANLEKTVKDAAPHVRTICTGLRGYLEAQATKFGEVRSELEKKRAAKTDRRCATFDNRTICVSESLLDRLSYASTSTGLASQEMSHLEARDDVATFCAAHEKLATAAGSGDVNKAETYSGIVDAVKAVPRAKPPKPAETPKESIEKPGEKPAEKPAAKPGEKPAEKPAEKSSAPWAK